MGGVRRSGEVFSAEDSRAAKRFRAECVEDTATAASTAMLLSFDDNAGPLGMELESQLAADSVDETYSQQTGILLTYTS